MVSTAHKITTVTHMDKLIVSTVHRNKKVIGMDKIMVSTIHRAHHYSHG